MHGYLSTVSVLLLHYSVMTLSGSIPEYTSYVRPTPRTRYQYHENIDTLHMNSNIQKNVKQPNITTDHNNHHHTSVINPVKHPELNPIHRDHTKNLQEPRMIYPSELEDRKPTVKRETCPFGLCEEAEDYPDDRIKNLLANATHLKRYFELPISIGNRNNFDTDDETLCDVKTHTTFPKTAKNIRNIEMTIVNVDGHQQGVVFEKCGTEGGACKFSETFPQGYITKCKQKFVIRRLMVLSKQEQFIFDNFEVPSCCVCTIKRMR